MANSDKIYTYGTGYLRAVSLSNDLERETDLGDVLYAPRVHMRLESMGMLEGQGGGIRLRNGAEGSGWGPIRRHREGKQWPSGDAQGCPPKVGLAMWTDVGEDGEPTHQDLIRCLEGINLASATRSLIIQE